MITPARRRIRLLATGAVVATALTACTSGSSPSTPDGWTRHELGHLSVAVPEGWVATAEGDELWTVGWADAEDLADASALLIGSPDFGQNGADEGLSTFVAGAQIGGVPGYMSTATSTPVETDTLEVVRNDYTYVDGAGTEFQGVFWAAAAPASGTTVALQLSGTDLPEDLVEGIQDSIRVLDGGAAAAS